eukprot:g11549.t1
MALPGMLPDPREIAEWPGAVSSKFRDKFTGLPLCRKKEYGDLPVAKGTVLRENGIRAAEQPAREVDLTVEMQRKARNQELDVKRNGIGCRSLGDKNYRHPEYMSRFFHSGEMVVGSSFHRGMHAKTEPRNSNTVHIEMDHRPPAKTYMQKQREKALQEAEAEVEDLTLRWEADTLKECSN